MNRLITLILTLVSIPQASFAISQQGRMPYNKELAKMALARTKQNPRAQTSMPSKRGVKRIAHTVKATTAELMGSQEETRMPSGSDFIIRPAMKNGDLQESSITPTIIQSFLNFDYQDTGQYAPSADLSVGTQQAILGSQGRICSFNKSTGQKDNVLNIAHDHFFSPISNGGFTSDPNIIFDPLSKRWFLFCNGNPNLLLAMSDGDPITPQTIWTFITVDTPHDPAFEFSPVPAVFNSTNLGVDANAVLCSVDVTNNNPLYISSALYVLPKQSLLNGGPVEIFGFRNLVDQNTLNGPLSSQGAQNFVASPLSYFVSSNAADFLAGYSTQVLFWTVSYTPNPEISPFVSVTVNPYRTAIAVPALGTPASHIIGGFASPRLSAAHIRNNLLWTCTFVGVDNRGASTLTTTLTRDGVRYWAFDVSGAHPVVTVDGTLFAASPTNDFNQRSFLTPSIMTNAVTFSNPISQVIIGATTCGANEHLNASVTQVVNGVAQMPVLYTQSNSNYFAQEDWDFPFAKWGDHTRTSPDPTNLSIWTCQFACDATNSWGAYTAQVRPNT